MAVDWYDLDPSQTPWSPIPEPTLVSRVMRHNRGPMTVLLDPKETQIPLTSYRVDGDIVGAMIIDSKGMIRWAGSAHDVAVIERELEGSRAPR